MRIYIDGIPLIKYFDDINVRIKTTKRFSYLPCIYRYKRQDTTLYIYECNSTGTGFAGRVFIYNIRTRQTIFFIDYRYIPTLLYHFFRTFVPTLQYNISFSATIH